MGKLTNLFNQKISFDDASFKNYVKPSIDIAYNMSAKKYNVAIKKFITIINSTSEKQDINNINTLLENNKISKDVIIKYYSKTEQFEDLKTILNNKKTDSISSKKVKIDFAYLQDQNNLNQLKVLHHFIKKNNINDLSKIDDLKPIFIKIDNNSYKNNKEISNSLVLYLKNTNNNDIKILRQLLKSDFHKDEKFKNFINDKNLFDKNYEFTDIISEYYFKHASDEEINELYNNLKNSAEFRKHFKKHHNEYDTFLSKFTTYGTLIANVALAQNSTEVKDAISASVLPVGSSRVKRNSNWSVTMNAFVGGFAGKAYYKEFVDDVAVKKSITSFGVIAPIGISINKGNLKMFNSNTALGLTLQVIDLGSLVNFYVQKGDGAELPNNSKIELGDIIAPGAMLSYSLGDSPFTILGGVQYVPNLNRMESIPTNKDFKPLTWRMHFGIAIDIPLFNLKVWN